MNVSPESGSTGRTPSEATPVGGAVPRPVGRWPRILTFSGAAVLVVALAAGVLAVVLFVRAVPFDLLGPAGEPGPGALASAGVPGSASVPLPSEPGTYAVWQIGPGTPGDRADGTGLDDEWDDQDSSDQLFTGSRLTAEDVTVTAPDGTRIPVRTGVPSGNVDRGSTHGELIGLFDAAGPVEIEVTDPGVAAGTSVVVAEGQDFGAFFGTVFGTIGAWFVAVGGGMLGFVMLVGGIVWWAVARNARPPGPPAGQVPPGPPSSSSLPSPTP